MKKYIFNNQKGAAFPIAIFMIILLTMLTGIMMKALNNEFRIHKVTEDRVIARYVAEAGAEHGIAAVYRVIDNGFNKLDEQGIPLEIEDDNPIEVSIPMENMYLEVDNEQVGSYTVEFYENETDLADFTFLVEDFGYFDEDDEEWVEDFRVTGFEPSEFIIKSSGVSNGRTSTIKAEVRIRADFSLKKIEHDILEWQEN